MTDLTISQLEKLIETQKNRVRDLNIKRKSLLEQIGEVDSQISEVTGQKRRRKRRKRRSTEVSKVEIGSTRVRHRGGKRLIDYIVNSLENSPATLGGLAEDVIGAGYESRAKNLNGSIAAAIYSHCREGNDNVQYHRDTKTYSVRGAEVQADEIAGGGYDL
jgi:hypothetical protein